MAAERRKMDTMQYCDARYHTAALMSSCASVRAWKGSLRQRMGCCGCRTDRGFNPLATGKAMKSARRRYDAETGVIEYYDGTRFGSALAQPV